MASSQKNEEPHEFAGIVVVEQSDATEGKRRKPGAGTDALASAPSLKRTRYDGKSFGDLTVSNLEDIVREAVSLQKQAIAKDEELETLRQVRSEKVALAKQLKLETQKLAACEKEIGTLKTESEDTGDMDEQASRVKKTIQKQFACQMVQYNAWMKEQLQGDGREISAFVANVAPALLRTLGIAQGSCTKHSGGFFGEKLVRTATNGSKMLLAHNMSMKYVKATCELRVDGVYKFEASRTGTGGSKRPKKGVGAAVTQGKDGEGEGSDGEGEGEDDEAAVAEEDADTTATTRGTAKENAVDVEDKSAAAGA